MRLIQFSVPLLIVFGILASPTLGADDSLKDDLRKLVEKFEKAIEARDARIKALEAQVKSLESKLAQAGSGGSAWVAKSLSNAFLGVGHTDARADLLSTLKAEAGALATEVLSGSPAATAGLQKGDVITSINGKPVNSVNLSGAVQTFKPGDKVKLAYARDGKAMEQEASLVDRDEYWVGKIQRKNPITLGVLISERDDGLVIKDVEDGFTASAAGLKIDDRLTHIDGTQVANLDQVGAVLSKISAGDRVTFQVLRGDSTVTTTVIGSDSKGGAKLVDSRAKAPGFLGIEAIEGAGGAVVDVVVEGSAAAAYGIRKGDVIKKLNGQDVTKNDALQAAGAKLVAGSKVSIVVSRGGESVEIKNIEIGAPGQKVVRPAVAGVKGEGDVVASPNVPAVIGSEVFVEEGGVVVDTVVADSAAAAYGLKKGDVIKKINGVDVTTEDTLLGELKKLLAGDTITMILSRDGEEVAIKNMLLGAEGQKVVKPKVPGRLGLVALQVGDRVVVKTIYQKQAAEKAGLQPGDVILLVNGKSIQSFADLGSTLKGRFAGDVLPVKVKRGEEEKEIEFALGE